MSRNNYDQRTDRIKSKILEDQYKQSKSPIAQIGQIDPQARMAARRKYIMEDSPNTTLKDAESRQRMKSAAIRDRYTEQQISKLGNGKEVPLSTLKGLYDSFMLDSDLENKERVRQILSQRIEQMIGGQAQ